jgi:hypothetical protein
MMDEGNNISRSMHYYSFFFHIIIAYANKLAAATAEDNNSKMDWCGAGLRWYVCDNWVN